TTGGWSVRTTVMAVLAVPERAFLAVKVTLKGPPIWLIVGVHVRVPDVFPGSGVKRALFPAGSRERSAVSEVMGLPSGSVAVTRTVIVAPTPTRAAPVAVTTGARSTLVTVIAVLAVPKSALEATSVTV